jgi:nitrogenase molybdenum-iron protein beta chain
MPTWIKSFQSSSRFNPSYVESHVEGYNRTIKALVEHLATPSVPNGKINIINGNLSPADCKQVKDLLCQLNCDSIILTDTSQNLDAPLTEETLSLYDEGTSIKEIEDTANSLGTISLSKHVDSAALFLEKKFGVKSISGHLPLGFENTDQFVTSVCELGDLEIPKSVERDRGRLLDAMVDAHSYNFHRKVAIFGDPDFVSGMTRFTAELGMTPSVVCTGTGSKRFKEDINIISKEKGINPMILAGGDLFDMHHAIKEAGADILIGNAYGASMAKEENIPLLRVGFPIFDRLGAQRISMLGYRGGIEFVDKITNTLLDFYYDEAGYEIVDEKMREIIGEEGDEGFEEDFMAQEEI